MLPHKSKITLLHHVHTQKPAICSGLFERSLTNCVSCITTVIVHFFQIAPLIIFHLDSQSLQLTPQYCGFLHRNAESLIFSESASDFGMFRYSKSNFAMKT